MAVDAQPDTVTFEELGVWSCSAIGDRRREMHGGDDRRSAARQLGRGRQRQFESPQLAPEYLVIVWPELGTAR